MKHLTLIGNKAADDYVCFSKKLQNLKPPKLYNRLFQQYDSIRNKNPVHASKIFVRIDSILKVMDVKRAAISSHWILDHPLSLLNSYIVYSFLKSEIEDDSLKMEFNKLSFNARKNSWGKELSYIVNNLIVGANSPTFFEKDTAGNKISLSDFIGQKKYILLDFWASWCGPCRKNNAALRDIYDAYQSKGFSIIGISLDQSKQKWEDAIKKDSLKWPQISDFQFWKNKIAQAYYIRSIPSNLLLDINGKILARNLSMVRLQQMLDVC